MQRLVIVGGGFAGFWSALSAVRQARALGEAAAVRVTLASRDGYLTNRPRLYEPRLDAVRLPLEPYCAALGIELLVDEVVGIDPTARHVSLLNHGDGLGYDGLILAAGSRVKMPELPGMARAFNIDTFEAASRLQAHLERLAQTGFAAPAARTVVVVGAGFTGLELATALPARLAALASERGDLAVHLVEKAPRLASEMSPPARDYIMDRLAAQGVRLHLGQGVAGIEPDAAVLSSGERIASETVVWTGGLEATPLTRHFAAERDYLGRLRVDEFLSLPQHPEVIVAGDAAKARVDESNFALMSCQHAMPQGRFAGHNAVSRLLGAEPRPYGHPTYVTCVDLGPDAALFTRGWARTLDKTGAEAKALKNDIVLKRIVPPADAEEALRLSYPEYR